MPLSYDQISAITRDKFIPKLRDNIFDSNVILKRIKEKSLEKLDGGLKVLVPLNYAQTTSSGWYSGAQTLSTTDSDVMTAASYEWKQLYATIAITGLDEAKNSGDSQILSFVKQKVQIAEKTMRDKLGDGLYSDGSDSQSIVGLRDIVATDQTVGGISQTTYTWWAAQVDASTTTLSIAKMQERYNACTVDNDHPTVIVTTRSIYNTFYGLLQPQQRFQDSKEASAGFQNLLFNGVPVFADSKCPASNMFMLNENYLHLFVHKDRDMLMEKFDKPVNQDVKVAKILWMGAFGSSNNRLHGKLSAITA